MIKRYEIPVLKNKKIKLTPFFNGYDFIKDIFVKCSKKTHPTISNTLFYTKDNKIYLEFDLITRTLWCRPEGFWDVLESEYNKSAVIEMISNHFKEIFLYDTCRPELATTHITNRWKILL